MTNLLGILIIEPSTSSVYDTCHISHRFVGCWPIFCGIIFRYFVRKHKKLETLACVHSVFDERLGLHWRPKKNWTLSPQVLYIENNSNIDIYSYDRTDVSLTFRRDFR